MGTPHFSVPALEALLKAGHDVIGVYTQPPKPAGRGHKLTKSPIHLVAEEKGIPVFTPKSLRKEEAQDSFKRLGADLGIVAAYGLILPKPILEAPKHGCINIHASLLPRWRGAAPIQRAIEAGDTKTGITLMQMDEGLDTGDMLSKDAFDITPDMTSQDAHDLLSQMGARLLIDLLETHPVLRPQKQDESLVTYAHKLEKSESALDFQESAAVLDRKIRAFTPWPGTHFLWKGQQIKVKKATLISKDFCEEFLGCDLSPGDFFVHKQKLYIKCKDDFLSLESLQLPGKKPMQAKDFINGYDIQNQGTLDEYKTS